MRFPQPGVLKILLAFAFLIGAAPFAATAHCQVSSQEASSNEDSKNNDSRGNATGTNHGESPQTRSNGQAVIGNTAGVSIDARQVLQSLSSSSVGGDLDLLRESSTQLNYEQETAETATTETARNYGTYFFGIPAAGRRFVYLLDMSTSMRERNQYGFSRFQIAATELLRAVEQLDEQQEFLVIAFCYQTLFFAADPAKPTLTKASSANKARLRTWIYRLQLGRGTDPRLGIVAGLRLRPDAIFLLSDGEFNGRKKNWHGIPRNLPAEHLIVLHRRSKTPIHTIAFEEHHSRARLAAIAMATGGMHRFVNH